VKDHLRPCSTYYTTNSRKAYLAVSKKKGHLVFNRQQKLIHHNSEVDGGLGISSSLDNNAEAYKPYKLLYIGFQILNSLLKFGGKFG
jgi:hypothetical protein